MLSKSTFLAGSAVLFLALSTPACAQTWGDARDRDRDRDRRWGQNDYQRQAYDNGYRRGMDRGERDGRDRRPANYRDERDYRNGDWGYNGRYGSRDYYRQAFRSGYEAGYLAGYNRYGRYGEGRAVPRYGDRDDYGRPAPEGRYGAYGYANNVGYQNGYRDGLEKGQKDWRGRKPYDLLRQGWYRDGDRHYKREYGPREDYRNAYRDGFKRGYDESFRGGRY
jgi:hypothetical protein